MNTKQRILLCLLNTLEITARKVYYIYYYHYVQPKIPVHESEDGETTRQHVITIGSNKYKS